MGTAMGGAYQLLKFEMPSRNRAEPGNREPATEVWAPSSVHPQK
jgi:hypothetical protein